MRRFIFAALAVASLVLFAPASANASWLSRAWQQTWDPYYSYPTYPYGYHDGAYVINPDGGAYYNSSPYYSTYYYSVPYGYYGYGYRPYYYGGRGWGGHHWDGHHDGGRHWDGGHGGGRHHR
jgi:hypothetical protein